MLDGIVDEGACEFVWLSVIGSWMERNKARGPVKERTNTCGLQQVSVPSIVARPVCLAHCAHPPTDGRKEMAERTALRVVRNGRKGRMRNSEVASSLARGRSMHGRFLAGSGKWAITNDNKKN